MGDEPQRVTINITGLVQGVFFRYGAKAEAGRLGLVGYAKNETDGSVSIVAEGPREKLEELLAWARAGTEHARVEHCAAKWEEAVGEFASFGVH